MMTDTETKLARERAAAMLLKSPGLVVPVEDVAVLLEGDDELLAELASDSWSDTSVRERLLDAASLSLAGRHWPTNGERWDDTKGYDDFIAKVASEAAGRGWLPEAFAPAPEGDE